MPSEIRLKTSEVCLFCDVVVTFVGYDIDVMFGRMVSTIIMEDRPVNKQGNVMLINRIIGAFTFRKGVYAEVEHDPSFTTTDQQPGSCGRT